MISEGKITIDLACGSKGRQNEVSILSSRPGGVARFLVGRAPGEAPTLLPMIFNICAMAHSSAAAQACLGNNAESPMAATGRQLVILCENAREHILRILTGWNRGGNDDMSKIPFQDVMSLVTQMYRAVSMGGDPFVPSHPVEINRAAAQTVSDQLCNFLQTHIFARSAKSWAELTTDEDVLSWSQSAPTMAAGYINNIYRQDWQALGTIAPQFLPDFPLADIRQKMHGPEGTDFILQPDWQGCPCETGPLARHHDNPLLGNLIHKYGAGLLVRHMARLVDLAEIPGEISRLLARTGADNVAPGMGQAETARGRLIHSVMMEKDRIADYRILAPTEWNFHRSGAAAQSLKQCYGTEARHQANSIITAIDPCVDFEVRVY